METKPPLNLETAAAIRAAKTLLTDLRIEEIKALAAAATPIMMLDAIHKRLTKEEDALLHKVWDTLPGASSWSSSWSCIDKREDWFGNKVD